MIIEKEKDLIALEKIGKIVAFTRDEMLKNLKPGITTLELDLIGQKVLNEFGATSAPKKVYNFPGYTCISVNDEVAYGVPRNRIIQKGDIVKIDVSAELNGYYADCGVSVVVESDDELKNTLCDTAKIACLQGIKSAVSGRKINQIGKVITLEAIKRGFRTIKNLCGHGIGKELHEEPTVLNFYYQYDDHILENGMVLAIETFISDKTELAHEAKDGWTIKTNDGSLSAQFEHTIIVTDYEPIILT